jgi:hypothetical protein
MIYLFICVKSEASLWLPRAAETRSFLDQYNKVLWMDSLSYCYGLGKDVEQSGHDVIWITYTDICLEKLRKRTKPCSVQSVHIPAARTWHLPIKIEKTDSLANWATRTALIIGNSHLQLPFLLSQLFSTASIIHSFSIFYYFSFALPFFLSLCQAWPTSMHMRAT